MFHRYRFKLILNFCTLSVNEYNTNRWLLPENISKSNVLTYSRTGSSTFFNAFFRTAVMLIYCIFISSV